MTKYPAVAQSVTGQIGTKSFHLQCGSCDIVRSMETAHLQRARLSVGCQMGTEPAHLLCAPSTAVMDQTEIKPAHLQRASAGHQMGTEPVHLQSAPTTAVMDHTEMEPAHLWRTHSASAGHQMGTTSPLEECSYNCSNGSDRDGTSPFADSSFS